MKKSGKKGLISQAQSFNLKKGLIICGILAIIGVGIVLISRASIPVYKTNWAFWGPRIAKCESGGRYNAQNSISTASGKYQFLDSTWNNYAGYPKARLAPPEIQEQKAYETFLRRGTQPWDASYHCWATSVVPDENKKVETILDDIEAPKDLSATLPGAQDVAGDAKDIVIVDTPPADGLDPWVASPVVQFLRWLGFLRI
jgi:hypothetical protein